MQPKKRFDLVFLKIGDKKISEQPCLFFNLTSFKLWADPIILKSLGLV